MSEGDRDRKRVAAAKGEMVQHLLDRLAEGKTVSDPAEFVERGAAAKLFRPESADEAGEVGEKVIGAILRKMRGRREIDWYRKTEKEGLEDLRGVDFVVQVNSDKYPLLGRVEIDATWNNEGVVRKMAALEEFLRKKGLKMSAAEYLQSTKKVILAASIDDKPLETLEHKLEEMVAYWKRKQEDQVKGRKR